MEGGGDGSRMGEHAGGGDGVSGGMGGFVG